MKKKTKKQSPRKDVHTISLLVANKPGVLMRIAMVFARRGYNIDSLVVSPSVDPRFSRMTVTAQGKPEILEQIVKQVAKLIDVIHASEHLPQEAIELEMALVKVRARPAAKSAITKLMRRFRAHIVDDSDNALVIEQTGTSAQLDEFENRLKKYGIIEMVRSGKLVMARGKEPT